MSAPMTTTTGARALVERTTIPRGMPLCVEDPVALARMAILLAPAEGPTGKKEAGPDRSGPAHEGGHVHARHSTAA